MKDLRPGFHIRKSRLLRRWWVTLVADNSRVLSHSEQLNSRQAALTNIAAQRSVAPNAETYE